MLSRSRYSEDWHAWKSMSDMQLGSLLGGGSYFWKGVRKKGGSDEPPRTPPPPWLRTWARKTSEYSTE